ncbi:GntP family permease [uncultured Sphingomonas sp.]|uniref:GntP family permease n=1 Tax=uncultured Sphingomonas sp. TaxID=158754 RepID=UPI0035CB36A6
MAVLASLISLAFLMFVAYRGFSVILLAPVAAMIPVLLLQPGDVPLVFTGVFMERAVGFIKLYFPLFLLGALFGKLMELSGFARALINWVAKRTGGRAAVGPVVLVSALLTYGGVSLFVVVFAVYPFAAELFRQAKVPKRLLPASMALGAFSFTMDALPGTPQIQNIIPTSFFGTTAWAAPWLGLIGSAFIAALGTAYLQWRVRAAGDEGYGENHLNEPVSLPDAAPANPIRALLPLVTVVAANALFATAVARSFGPEVSVALPGVATVVTAKTSSVAAIWALEGALLLAILLVIALRFRHVVEGFSERTRPAIAGALLAAMNTASEYGYGAVIAALPGFIAVRNAVALIPDPLVNAAVVTTTLAGITGSASGGLGIALGAMGERFGAAAQAAGIPLEVMHRVTAMASGGMDALPHNGAVITVLAVTGLTHRQAYKDIFAITLIKTAAVFVVIGVFYATGIT